MLIFDISTLASTGGQAVGIVRVVREIAVWAYAHRSDVAFVVYDTKIEAYCQIQPRWTKALVDGSAMVDMSTLPSCGAEKSHLRDRLTGPLRTLALWSSASAPARHHGIGAPTLDCGHASRSATCRAAPICSAVTALPSGTERFATANGETCCLTIWPLARQ